MANDIEEIAARVQGVEGSLERLATRIDRLSESVDQRFEQVDQRFEQVDQRFEQVDQRFEQVDRRFEQVDRRFDEVSAALVEQRQYTEFAYSRLEATMDAGFSRVERKLDQLIDLNRRRPRSPKRRR